VGIVQRFGRFVRTDDPGLRFKIPFGADSVTLVPMRRQLKLEFGYSTPGAGNPFQASQAPEMERSMVTGDLNEAVVEWVVQYRINDPKRYLFDVRDPEETLRAVSEAVMREVIGDRTVDEVITIGRQDIEVETKAVLQKVAEQYQLGMSVDLVQLKNVNPPKQVQPSFDEVNQAQQEKQRAINLANGDYNKAVPRAKGDAERLIAEAHGYALKRVNEAEGDAALFDSVFAQYRKAPEVTRQRIFLETMTEVLPKTGRKIIVDEKSQQVLPLLQFQPEK
jgi:membrane protease subunit HflK